MVTTTKPYTATKPRTNFLALVSGPGLIYFWTAALSVVLVLLLTSNGPKQIDATGVPETMALTGP